MQLVCVAEVTPDYTISVDENIKKQLHPGEKIKIRIEPILTQKESERLKAIERLKGVSRNSRLGLFKETVGREDAHNMDSVRNI